MVEISLTQGEKSLVDDEDADLARHNWYVQKRSKHSYGKTSYALRRITKTDGKRGIECLHRVIAARMGLDLSKKVVDHINGNGLDNRRNNLRVASISENSRNRGAQKNSKSGVKGVVYIPRRGKWGAFIAVDGKLKNLGEFQEKEDAQKAYEKAAANLHGSFARTK